jgi:hypothetical protein
LAVHGVPRATGDIDLWIHATPDNAARVMAALSSFGAPRHDLVVDDLAKPGVVFQIGVPPRRIDILTDIDGVSFDEAWRERMETSLAGLIVPVLVANI